MTEGPKTCTGSSRETGFQSLLCDCPLALTLRVFLTRSA